jgi:hypothetical protein
MSAKLVREATTARFIIVQHECECKQAILDCNCTYSRRLTHYTTWRLSQHNNHSIRRVGIMPSHLTRQVFRRIIANEPIIYRGCLRRQGYSSTAYSNNGRRLYLARDASYPAARRYEQRRTLFGLGGMFRQKAPRDTREANYDPGIEKMMEYAKMKRLEARLPPVEDVAHAIRLFSRHKSPKRNGNGTPMEDTQAQLVLQNLRYCLETREQTKFESNISADDLAKLAQIAISKPRQVSPAHMELAKILYEELSSSQNSRHARHSTEAYVRSLTWSGRTEEARELILKNAFVASVDSSEVAANKEQIDDVIAAEEGADDKPRMGLWNQILAGFSQEGNEEELLRTLAVMKKQGVDYKIGTATILLDFYIAKQDPVAVKQFWSDCQSIFSNANGDHSKRAIKAYNTTVSQVLTWCLASGNLPLGHEVVKDVMTSNPSKPIWDAVLVWGAGTKKSVEEIGRMLDVMQNSNETITEESEWRIPDSATVNSLVRYAISQNDPYMAERFIGLGRDRGIQPDAETFILQMDYRLSVNDVDGALVAYKHLQAQDLSTNSDVNAVNRLVVALCTSQRHDFETIMSVVADLSDREARFDPITVSTLSVLHLNRDEIHDVIDLLNTHSFGYSSAERASIRQSLVDYCLDSRTTTTRAWDTYTILRSIFDEMAREQRTSIMLNFFAHERADMAVNVFNHMRHHSRHDTMPNDKTYVSAFLGCAKLGDLESLEVVHNQLKLDYNVSQTTYCRNALIIAYSVCDRPRAALDYWDDIVASREGPTYNSIHIALRACEKSAFGDIKAQEIWARLRKNNVELDQSMWASYIAALAGNGDNELARTVLEEAEQKGEVEVDAFLLGSFLDASPGQMKQADIEMWAEERYPEVWRVLKEDIGWVVEESRMKKVKIDRTVTP